LILEHYTPIPPAGLIENPHRVGKTIDRIGHNDKKNERACFFDGVRRKIMGWIGGVTGGATAAIAAANAAKNREEETAMLDMLKHQNSADWEYKIVRSALFGFDRKEKIREMLEQEARAGWSMAAKLDGDRVVLKRPVAMRDHDHLLGDDIDPYRTDYGGQAVIMVSIVTGITLLLMLAVVASILVL
jgi:hypothetical protein